MNTEKQLSRRLSITRREAMRRGLAGAGGFLLANAFGLPAWAETQTVKAKAKSVIQIWMWGGPSHLDTFDPKPEAGYDYCGPLNKPIATNVDGIVIGELLPLLAKQADKYSIIRSMTHGINAHETASYMVQTGRKPGERMVYPGVGAVVSLFRGYDAGYQGSDSAIYRANRVAGTVFRGGISGQSLQTLRHRRRSGTDQVRRGRHSGPRRYRSAATRPARTAPQFEHL